MWLDEQLIEAAQDGDVVTARAALDGGANRECKDNNVRPVAVAQTASCLCPLRPRRRL
jgi:hypothetical protein